MLSTTFPQEQEISLACNILRGMTNDPKKPGSKSENSSFESRAVEQQGEIEEVKTSENKVTNGAGAAPVQEKNKKGKEAAASRTFVISAEEMGEFKLMKAVLATRLGKALFLDYLEGDIGRSGKCLSFFYQPFLLKGMLT